MTIKAIETYFAGYHFRSRLEARWAVFFEQVGIPYEYEPERYALRALTKGELSEMWRLTAEGDEPYGKDLGTYLPDFYLPQQKAWFEVKPPGFDGYQPDNHYWKQLQRFGTLAGLEGKSFYLASGEIPNPDRVSWTGPDEDDLMIYSMTGWDNYYAWTVCGICRSIDIQYEARSSRNSCECKYPNGGDGHNGDDPLLLTAYGRARRARFEHGETPR